MKRKKITAMLLCAGMVMAMLGGCQNARDDSGNPGGADHASSSDVGAKDNYDETIAFSLTSYNTITGVDYTDDALYKYIAEKFQIDVDVWANEVSGAAEKERIWINGGTMPDIMKWEDFNFSEYYTYVNQGLLQPLPEGWETKWPNIAKLVNASGIYDLLQVDGKTYGIPCAVFGNNVNFDVVPTHVSLYVRADWAREIGMDNLGDDYTISISELKEYLEKVDKAGLTSNPTLAASLANMIPAFYFANGINTNQFIDNGNEWIWGPTQEGVTDVIAQMREWYQAGLLDRDFYTKEQLDYENAFTAGQNAAFFAQGNADGIARFRREYSEAYQGKDGYEDITVACLTAEDGSAYASETGNYWTVNVFSPNTDEKTMERILDLIDWIAGPEGQTAEQMGIPEVDWKYDEDGRPLAVNEGVYVSQDAFYLLGYCLDDFQMAGVKSNIGEQDIEECLSIYDVKEQGTIFPYSWAYEISSSDARKSYSVDWQAKISELVVGEEDIETSWNSFVEENRNLWEPLVQELNEESGY